MILKIAQKYFVFLGILLITLLGSCKAKDEKIKVGFLFNTIDLPRWERERDYFEERIKELGAEFMIANADGDDNKQYTQALEFIENGVDVIVITPSNVVMAAAIVREAHENGIKVIAYDGLIQNSDLDYSVGFELYKVGELQAQYMLQKKPSGNYIILNGDKVHNAAVDMYNGIMKVLSPSINDNKINIIYTAWMEGWSGVNASYHLGRILDMTDENIDVIMAANDGIAGGIAVVLKERGLDKKILITGQDGDLSACNRIINGEQTMTVYKSSKKIAFATAEMAIKVAKNESIEGLETRYNGRLNIPTLILEPIPVDKTNLESTIVAEGIYTMDEIINYSEK